MFKASVTIHSPLSIVKELVENSLDGGATSIYVQTDSSTLGSLVVKDNGSGINPEDRMIMACPSTTSKIRKFEDIQDVKSFGYRGEALSAIADICESGKNNRMIIISRVLGESHAVRWSVDKYGQPILPYLVKDFISISSVFEIYLTSKFYQF